MERKVIQMGSSSLVVSLPKKWVEKAGITKGETISIEEIPSGELVIKPTHRPTERKTVEIKDGDLDLSLFSSYINGADEIILSPDYSMETVYGLLGDYMGLEVTKAGQDGVVIEYYGEPVPPRKLLSRFSIITGNYLNALAGAFREHQDLPLLNIKKVKEKDKLYHGILRNLLLASGNTVLALELEVNAMDIVPFTLMAEGYRDLVSIVENIEYMETDLDESLAELFDEIQQIFKGSMKVWAGKESVSTATLFDDIETVTRQVRSTKNKVLRKGPMKKEKGFLLMEDVMESKAERMRGLVTTPKDVYLKDLLDNVLQILAILRSNLEIFTLRHL